MDNRSLTLEQAMTRIEEISNILDGGDCALEDMLGLYDEAQKLVAFCKSRLNDAKLRVTTVKEENDVSI